MSGRESDGPRAGRQGMDSEQHPTIDAGTPDAFDDAAQEYRRARRKLGLDAPPGPGPVRFETDSDADASRISAVLEALGYQVTRVGMTDEDARIKYALGVIARRCHLTPRESAFARAMIDDIVSPTGLAMHFCVSLQTAKWVKNNIQMKLGTGNVRRMIDRIAEAP